MPGEQAAGSPSRSTALALLGLAAVALAIMAFFLVAYPARGLTAPMGWDTSRYVWRTALIQQIGLTDLPSGVPPHINSDPGRPGFPLLAAVLGSATGAGNFRVAAVLPPISAAAIGLAAGAFAVVALRRPRWEGVVVAAAMGTSTLVVRLAGPETYQDNLLAAAVFMAVGVIAALAVRHRGPVLAAILLLGLGGIIHGPFFGFMAGVLVLVAATYAPSSWRAWRSGQTGLLDTPAARLGGVALGGAAVAGIGIYGLLSTSSRPPRLSRSEFDKKLREDLARYRFPLLLPVAALGALAVAADRPAGGRAGDGTEDAGRGPFRAFALRLLLIWSAVALAAVPAFLVLDIPLPAHRFLAYALPLPLLAVVGVLAAGRFVSRRWSVALGVVLAGGLLVAATALSFRQWIDTPDWVDPVKVAHAGTAAAYLDAAGVPAERPVVFIVRSSDWNYAALMGHMLRAGLPPERIRETYVYNGTPEDFLARRPSGPPDVGAAISRAYFVRMEEAYARDPVGVMLSSFYGKGFQAWIEEHPEARVAPNVAVVRGPVPGAPVDRAVSPVGPYSSLKLGLLAVGGLGLLTLVGAGWSLGLLGRWLERPEALALSPAFGISLLALSGLLLDRVGVRLAGPGPAVAALALPFVSGWALAWWRRRAEAAGEERASASG